MEHLFIDVASINTLDQSLKECCFHYRNIGEIYNIGGHNEMRNIDIMKNIYNAFGKLHDIITISTDYKGHCIRYAIDTTKIQNKLGWLQKTNIFNGLKKRLNCIWKINYGGKKYSLKNILNCTI